METFITHFAVLVIGFGLGVLFSRNVRGGIADLHGKVDALRADIRAKL